MLTDTFRSRPSTQLLPSADAALAFARGEQGSGWAVLASTGARVLVVTPACLAVGVAAKVPARKALLFGVAAALAIEVGVLALAFSEVSAQRKRKGAPVLTVLEGGVGTA